MGTLSTAVRNAACNAVVDSIDQHASAGYLRFLASGGTVVAQLTFNDPAYGNAGASVAGRADMSTSTAVQDTNANATETVATASIYAGGGTSLITGITCSTSGAEINLSSLAISSGDTVTLSSLYVTMPASTSA